MKRGQSPPRLGAPLWEKYQVGKDLRAGRRGAIQLVKFKISKEAASNENLRQLLNFQMSRRVAPGSFVKLIDVEARALWMSDTPAEIRDLIGLFRAVSVHSNGTGATVLLHGLGLGVALNGAFVEGASHVTVVERNDDVIKLVGAQWEKVYGDRLTIIKGDALTHEWPRGAHWDVVWHDIWPDISDLNAETMGTLHRRFGRRSNWQGSWARDVVKKMQREIRSPSRTHVFW